MHTHTDTHVASATPALADTRPRSPIINTLTHAHSPTRAYTGYRRFAASHRLSLRYVFFVLLKNRIRGNGEVIRREEFEQRKEASEQARQARLNKKPKKLASQGKHVEEFPLLQVRGVCVWRGRVGGWVAGGAPGGWGMGCGGAGGGEWWKVGATVQHTVRVS